METRQPMLITKEYAPYIKKKYSWPVPRRKKPIIKRIIDATKPIMTNTFDAAFTLNYSAILILTLYDIGDK